MPDLAIAYYKIFIKTLELRNLLADILIRFQVIDSDNNESFYQLLSYIPQIDTIYPYEREPNILKTFDTLDEIETFLYTNNHTNVSLLQRTVPEINQVIIDTFLSYNLYLKDYLITVGLEPEIVNTPKTLKHYIECLYQIERKKNTIIVISDHTLYRNVHNDLALTVTDDMDNIIEEGTIIIRENGLPIYEGSILEAYIQPTTMGEHTYTFEYIPGDEVYYKRSNLTDTFNVQSTPISIDVEATNLNPNSIYYESEDEGYSEDEWRLIITTKDPLDNKLSNIPIKIYIGNTLVCEDYTDIFGTYTYYCQLPYSSNFENNITVVKIQTNSFNAAYSNKEYLKEFMIYHHLFEADNEYYIGQLDNIKIRLVDQVTGEPLVTSTMHNDIEQDLFEFVDEYEYEIGVETHNLIEYIIPFDMQIDTNLSSCTVPHPFFDQDIRVRVHLNDRQTTYTLSSNGGEWELEAFIWYFDMVDGDIATLTIMVDDYEEQQTVNIKSNFILPKENVFYVPNQPVIYYKPFGEIFNGEIEVMDVCEVHDSLISLPNFQVGEHTIYLHGHRNGPSEVVTYTFTVKEPLELIQYEYEQTTCAKYYLNVYDKQSVDRLENHLSVDGYEQYIIQPPNEISIDLINNGYSVISLYDANTNIVDINNEYNKISFDDEEYTLNKNNDDWNNIIIKIEQPNQNENIFTYKFYIDNILKYQKQAQHNDELKIFIIVPSQEYYDNFNIQKIYTPITVINNNNEIDYVYVKREYADYYQYDIHICRNDDNQGSNTICASLNNYIECDTFELYSRTFYILPSNLKVGNNTIQVQCFNDNANGITLTHNSITQNHVTNQNNIFVIDCDIYETGDLSVTLDDGDGNVESFVLHVQPGDYIINLDMPETKEYQDHTPIPLHIKDAFNNEVNSFYCWFDSSPPNQTILINKSNNDGIILNNTAIGRQFDSLDMGTHTINVQTVANSNYNTAFVTQEFILGIYISSLTDQPLFTNLSGDNDGWLVNESISIDNETVIRDLEDVLVGINTSVDVDPGQLLLANFISSNSDLDSIILLDDDFHNIQNAIIDIDVEEDKLTYDTIEDDNL